MDEQSNIISIIKKEFNDLSLPNLLNDFQKIQKNDIKQIKIFTLKTITDIDNALTNSINNIKSYYKNNYRQKKSNIITQIYSKTRNKSQIFNKNYKNSAISLKLDDNKNNYKISYESISSNPPLSKNQELLQKIQNNINNINNFYKSHKKFRSKKVINTELSKSLEKNKKSFHTREAKKEHENNKDKSQIYLSCSNININTMNNNLNEKLKINEKNIYINFIKDFISFIENMEKLQETIIQKLPNIKEKKIEFEKQKNNLYNKAINLYYNNQRMNNPQKFKKINEINFSFIEMNNQGYIATVEESNSTIIQLKSEIIFLNNKIKEKELIEKQNKDNIEKYFSEIRKIYEYLLSHFKKEIIIIPKIKKNEIDWFIKEILYFIESIEKYNENIKINNINYKNLSIKKEINLKILYNKKPLKEDSIQCIVIEDKNKSKSNKNNDNNIKLSKDKIIEQIKKEIIKLILNLKYWNLNIQVININTIVNEFNEYDIIKSFQILKAEITQFITLYGNKNNTINKENNDKTQIKSEEGIIKLNANLLLIQKDLVNKLENKQKELEDTKIKLKKSLKLHSDFINYIKEHKSPQEINIFAEKYKFLYNLYNNEKRNCLILQKEYVDMLSRLNEYVNNGKNILIDIGNLWDVSKSQNEEIQKELGKNEEKNKNNQKIMDTICETLKKITKETEFSEKNKKSVILLLKLLKTNEEEIKNIFANKNKSVSK